MLFFLIFFIGGNVEFSVRVVLGGGGVDFGGKDGVLNECWDGELFGSYLQSKECRDIGVWVGYFNFYFLFFGGILRKSTFFCFLTFFSHHLYVVDKVVVVRSLPHPSSSSLLKIQKKIQKEKAHVKRFLSKTYI